MFLDTQALLIASTPLPDPKTLRTEQGSESIVKDDPLIAKGWENTAFIGAGMLILGILTVVGIFSQRIEYVMITGLVISLIIIACFLVVGL
ncbi:MAG: hypothetical protein ACHBN1_21915 [Heteroscytonema crispum UTEX LB 1556]